MTSSALDSPTIPNLNNATLNLKVSPNLSVAYDKSRKQTSRCMVMKSTIMTEEKSVSLPRRSMKVRQVAILAFSEDPKKVRLLQTKLVVKVVREARIGSSKKYKTTTQRSPRSRTTNSVSTAMLATPMAEVVANSQPLITSQGPVCPSRQTSRRKNPLSTHLQDVSTGKSKVTR